jgi:pimeloyl-ACP methyl ester carboxylesterase
MTDAHRRPAGMRLLDPRPFVLQMRRTLMTEAADTTLGKYVNANGIDIHYVEQGSGPPLVLLNNGMISTNPVWADWISSYERHRVTLADHFRVIEPDFRGSGRTVQSDGPIPYDVLADDMAAFIDALGLDRPFIGGYGDGAAVATIVGIRTPQAVGAIVNHGDYDLFDPDPESPNLVMTRQMLGGRPDATQADPDAVEAHEYLHTMVELMRADHDVAQGEGHWKTVLRRTFERVSRPSGYTVDDLRAIAVPTLILVGDRDPFCSVEQGAAAYRALADGELAVLPGTPNGINAAALEVMIAFLVRKLG